MNDRIPCADPVGVPCAAGIGLRTCHFREILGRRPKIGWVEVHSENFFGAGGQPRHWLERICEHYPVSLHGVGLSLGSAGPLDRDHLDRLTRLVRHIEPGLVSEHLSWSMAGQRHLNELLPLPYTDEALAVVCAHVDQVQDVLGRQILVENISRYLGYRQSTMTEPEFLAELVARSGCGLLLDVNNVYVSAHNLGFDARDYLEAIPAAAVAEIHLAGHARIGGMLVDTHGTRVADPVWELYAATIERLGARPTLIEWDNDIPPLAVLLGEAERAAGILEATDGIAA
ncbi:MAG: DUF692 domain-containing protein [Rhodocyclaceae bacterium]|nr:DUF692 domain-containing protein [Rhodocyclaceae bacterium]